MKNLGETMKFLSKLQAKYGDRVAIKADKDSLTFVFKAEEARALLLYINGVANADEKKLVRELYNRLSPKYEREIEGNLKA